MDKRLESKLCMACADEFSDYPCEPSECRLLHAMKNAAEVVRCKDCKYWKPGDSFGGDSLDDMQRIGGCPIVRFARREKDFCCDGERKDNG